ncbi:hypothetical protein EJV47_08395 [Hymenobacter gummosus]|uniref:Uncharacterized protein n=1 Tax=Hymenobacter gummosus TaxID=1776032 RepID=A0A431U4D3_9BACT|nr:hypothetical protein [Hymenobacter gummosus]RTQ50644.1 hypothetical protein EJV47_08395 [Hymenobacter gummosus]
MSTFLLRSALGVLLAGLGWLFWPSRPLTSAATDFINPVLGNASFQTRFGRAPGAADDEATRIATHLAYAEALLRGRNVQHLPAEQQRRRATLLNYLHRYRTAGVFPRNEQYPGQRRPCFIDGAGRICAVGYLVEQTGGRALAERVNAAHQYDYIRDMRSPELAAWVAQSGLSLEECAMIQPTYGYPRPPSNNYVSGAYGAGTAAWSGLNAPLAALNASRAMSGRPSKGLAVVGLASGLGQAALGTIVLIEDNSRSYDGHSYNESKKAVSFLNVGLGTATAVLGAWNLWGPKTTQPRTTVEVGSYSSPAEPSGGVLTLTRRF